MRVEREREREGERAAYVDVLCYSYFQSMVIKIRQWICQLSKIQIKIVTVGGRSVPPSQNIVTVFSPCKYPILVSKEDFAFNFYYQIIRLTNIYDIIYYNMI